MKRLRVILSGRRMGPAQLELTAHLWWWKQARAYHHVYLFAVILLSRQKYTFKKEKHKQPAIGLLFNSLSPGNSIAAAVRTQMDSLDRNQSPCRLHTHIRSEWSVAIQILEKNKKKTTRLRDGWESSLLHNPTLIFIVLLFYFIFLVFSFHQLDVVCAYA